MGLFVLGGSVATDCATSDSLPCSQPDVWGLVAVGQAIVLIVLLSMAIIGVRNRIRASQPPMAWAVGCTIASLVVMATAWLTTALA